MARQLAQELIDLLEPRATHHGLELVTVEVLGSGHRRLVRVYLDRPGGIDIETIAASNAWISEALDGVSALSGPYTLEVSSPGLDRPLRTPADYERFSGRQVTVHARTPLEGRSRFSGELRGLDGDDVVVATREGEYRVPFDSIERARLKAELDDAGEGSRRHT